MLRRRPAAEDPLEDTQDLRDRPLADTWPGGFRPGPGAPLPGPRARVSAWATLSLVLGLVGLCTTLTGLLVPEGLALGVLAVLASIAGSVGASRPGVTGHSLALLGLLTGLAATGLAAAALTGHLSWLDSHADAVPRWHTWLVAHWPWLRRW
jgi:hypothetical protein